MGLALLGLPIAFAMGVAAMAALWFSGVDFSMVPQRMMFAVNSFPLMSIPFFMLAGELMIKAGIVERLIGLANSIVGRVRGGMAHVAMLSGAGLATVSGAAVSDASALSAILVPSLSKIYDKGFAAALVAAAANLGPIIPPSGAMIVYAFMAGSSVSVGGMFMAGVVPGIIICAGFMALCSWIATRRGWAVTGEPFRITHVLHELRRSFDRAVDAGDRDRRHRRRRVHGDRRRRDRGRLLARHRIFHHAPAQGERPAGHRAARRDYVRRGRRADRVRIDHHVPDDGGPAAAKALGAAARADVGPARVSRAGRLAAVRRRHVPRIERGLHHAGAAAASDRACSTASIHCTSGCCSC